MLKNRNSGQMRVNARCSGGLLERHLTYLGVCVHVMCQEGFPEEVNCELSPEKWGISGGGKEIPCRGKST